MLEIKDAIKVLEMVDAYGIASEAKDMAIEALRVCESLEELGNFIETLDDFMNELCKANGSTNDVMLPPTLIIDYFKESAQRVKDAGAKKCDELVKKQSKPTEKPNKAMSKKELLEKLIDELEKRP